jgi:spermidine synthase
VSARFEELDWRPTPMGTISLRRRRDPLVDQDVYEVKLDDDFLMSSLFTVAEREVARRALAELAEQGVDVVVGGLGLGYTAQAVLEDPGVGSLLVIDTLGAVIEWHQRGLIPLGSMLTSDHRCRLIHGDFFAMARSRSGFDPEQPGRRFHAVIVDIDHSPRHLLHPSHAGFYEAAGLHRLADQLHPGGVFSLWSNDPPDESFSAVLGEVFADVRAEIVSFRNPLQEREATNTVYLARRPR